MTAELLYDALEAPFDKLLLLRDPALLRLIQGGGPVRLNGQIEPAVFVGKGGVEGSDPMPVVHCFDRQDGLDAAPTHQRQDGGEGWRGAGDFLAAAGYVRNGELSAVATVRVWLEDGTLRGGLAVARWIARLLAGTADNPTEEHHGAAKRALQREDDELARSALDETEVRDRLARGILNAFRELVFAVGMDKPGPHNEQEAEEAALSRSDDENADELLARWLSTRWGELGNLAAEHVRRWANEQWSAFRGEVEQPSFRVWWAEPRPAILWGTWLPTPEDDPPVLKIVARLVWRAEVRPWWKAERHERARREEKAPAILIGLSNLVLGAGARARVETDAGGVTTMRADGWTTMIPAAAALTAAREVLTARKALAVGAMMAYLVTEVHRRWQAGENRFDYVPVPAGRNAIGDVTGAKLDEAEIDAAIEWLMAARAAGWPFVVGVQEQKWQPPGGGRPAKGRLVHVGAPLAPQSLDRVYNQSGLTLPADLRWVAPVLPPTHVPPVGNRRTRGRQRLAFTLGLGAALVGLRDRYAERGGIELDDLRRPLLDLGIYHRARHSLVDDILDAWRTPPERPLIPGLPTAPALVESPPGSRIYRLGPDYEDAHQLILREAKRTEEGRARQKKGSRRR